MDFKDLERTRQIYQQKSQATSKKRWRVILITCFILFSFEIIFLIFRLSKSSELNTKHFAVLAIPIPFVLLFEFLFISLIVYIATHKDSTILAKHYADYRRIYKAYFIHRQLTKFFTDLHYDHTRGLDKSVLQASRLIYTGDIYESNDLVVAKYKNTNFAQADVKIIREDETRD